MKSQLVISTLLSLPVGAIALIQLTISAKEGTFAIVDQIFTPGDSTRMANVMDSHQKKQLWFQK